MNEFIVFVGPMASCKTSKLLMSLEKSKYRNEPVILFKPKIDDRYSDMNVVSHAGWSRPAISISTGNEIIGLLAGQQIDPKVVAVDEAFMITGIADVLIWLYRNGYNIVVSSLDLSSTCKPFIEVQKMSSWATHVEKCSAVCSVCGKDAFYTYRKITNIDTEISVGGLEAYEPRCYNCHPFMKVD